MFTPLRQPDKESYRPPPFDDMSPPGNGTRGPPPVFATPPVGVTDGQSTGYQPFGVKFPPDQWSMSSGGAPLPPGPPFPAEWNSPSTNAIPGPNWTFDTTILTGDYTAFNAVTAAPAPSLWGGSSVHSGGQMSLAPLGGGGLGSSGHPMGGGASVKSRITADSLRTFDSEFPLATSRYSSASLVSSTFHPSLPEAYPGFSREADLGFLPEAQSEFSPMSWLEERGRQYHQDSAGTPRALTPRISNNTNNTATSTPPGERASQGDQIPAHFEEQQQQVALLNFLKSRMKVNLAERPRDDRPDSPPKEDKRRNLSLELTPFPSSGLARPLVSAPKGDKRKNLTVDRFPFIPIYIDPQQSFDTPGPKSLAKRPRDWRPDYTSRGRLRNYIPAILNMGRNDVKDYSDSQPRSLHPLLLHKPGKPPVVHDLRDDPFGNPHVFPLSTSINNLIHFAQLATSPSCTMMRLYHASLPWFVDVRQSYPNGVTVNDVLVALWTQLLSPISGRHFWNEETTDEDRYAVSKAFEERCHREALKPDGNARMWEAGVCQVDFLGTQTLFVGLVKGKHGHWEMKLEQGYFLSLS